MEDEPLVQARLIRLLVDLGYSAGTITCADTLAQARALSRSGPFAIALVDLRLPDGDGLDLIKELRAADPALRILVISAWSARRTLYAALRAGATGYVLKERDDLEVSLSIRSILRGGAPIDPFIAHHIIAELPFSATPSEPAADSAGLSPREQQILTLVAKGLSNREIAESLYLSRYTVECHIKNVYRKLEVSSRTRAVNEARSIGLVY
ncbi:response regulator transcription factor [Luteimonas sp. TWI1416]|uniref:response regulator transcription factor n=1 Tax=unclassified Luteimonas TaxID=2629088 RepID=UPI0032081948